MGWGLLEEGGSHLSNKNNSFKSQERMSEQMGLLNLIDVPSKVFSVTGLTNNQAIKQRN